ncbi:C25 family cysteine peptidase [Corallococcus sp. AB049A]|uniref:C25 family cysteine peptidase n=1 Tax=Corallococcus sp. AB049A TaxID=2316721 RepID=UPI00131591EC|nr:C25 family cysteine peptidase [Corallococcus sp. AB049A]
MERPINRPEDPLVLNGIDGTTGQYLVPPIALPAAAEVAEPQGQAAYFEAWRKWLEYVPLTTRFGLPFDVRPEVYAEAGWGVVFPASASEALRQSLDPLLVHRHARVEPGRFHILTYQPGETAHQFLQRYGAAIGDVDPDAVPYYLLLVGGPDAIPFDVQHSLSLSYAVGRLSFDTTEEYARYAASVVAYETDEFVPNHRQVSWWGPKHPGDRSTELSADSLVAPLARGAPLEQPPQLAKTLAAKARYTSRDAIEDDATREWLLEALHGRVERPAVLFTASHGVGFKANDPLQLAKQGALLSQDWSGFGAMTPEHYVAASDIQDDAKLHGLVAFFFACFGVGTPAHDEFPMTASRGGDALANAPFIAALPRRLLAHPNGGALAVIGHVERAWGFSIKPLQMTQATILPFRNTLGWIMGGLPVGYALKDFRDRLSDANNILLTHLDANTSNGKLQPRELLHRWIERNDARNYVVLGDPAVSIRQTALKTLP